MAKANKQVKTESKVETAAPVTETKGKRVPVTITTDMQKVLDGFDSEMTTSAKIRALHAQGWSRSQIAKGLGVIYQHVRNVLITPLKKQA